MENKIRQRATAIIIEDDKILMIRDVKTAYVGFMFPGGGVDEGETVEQSLIREVKEELSFAVIDYELLKIVETEVSRALKERGYEKQFSYCFLIKKYAGTLNISGPEKERLLMDEYNQYYLEWVPLLDLKDIKNIYPQEVVKVLANHLNKR